MEIEKVIAEQVAYYRARAPEYDEWWRQLGRYDHGPAAVARFRADVAELEAALDRFNPTGDVLEIASGTGWWTSRLARSAGTLTCIDTAPETIALNRQRLAEAGLPAPVFIEADIFTWEPEARYDVVAFSFWLSHIPASRFTAFWQKVRRALKPGGRVFFLDEAPGDGPYHTPTDEEGRQPRVLNDGRRFTIIKIYYSPAEIVAKLGGLGWQVEAHQTHTHFMYGTARAAG